MGRVEVAAGTDGDARGASRKANWGAVVLVVLLVALATLAWRAVPHPIGPARTFDKYEGKAVTTSKSAESAVQTVLLVSRAAGHGNTFGPYTALVVADAEDIVSGLQGTFDSIQPPDDRASDLGATLDTVLGDALEHVRDVRVAARRGEISQLSAVAAPLRSDAAKLAAFQEDHT